MTSTVALIKGKALLLLLLLLLQVVLSMSDTHISRHRGCFFLLPNSYFMRINTNEG